MSVPVLAAVEDPPTRAAKRLDIQGMRAIAVLMVVAFHSGLPVPGGFTGVDVFFVISGFVITEMLERELLATSKIRLGRFYARRVRRILPVLAIAVVVTVIAAVFLQSPLHSEEQPQGAQQVTAETGLGAVMIVANWVIYRMPGGGYFQATSAENPLLHTWSLSVEEQFYLIFPALLALAWIFGHRIRKDRRFALLLVGGLGLASFALCVVFTYGLVDASSISQAPEKLAFYASPTRAWEFAAGSLTALVFGSFADISRALSRVSGAAGVLLVGVAAFAISERTTFPGLAALIPVVGTVLLLVAGANRSGEVTGALSVRPLVFVGDVSYGWYLFHWPVIVFTLILVPSATWLLPVVAGAALIPSWLSYRFVENPIRSGQRFRGRLRVPMLAACCILVPAAFCGFMYLGAKAFWWQPPIKIMAEQIESRPSVVCPVGPTPPEFARWVRPPRTSEADPVICVWNAGATGLPIVLVGDSNAGQFTEALVGTGVELNRPVVVAWLGACPFALVDARVDARGKGEFNDSCRAFVAGMTSLMRAQGRSDVFLASSGDLYVNGQYADLRAPGATSIATTSVEKAELYKIGLENALKAVSGSGNRVTLIQTIPHFDGWWPTTCPNIRLMISPASCGVSSSLDEIELQLATVNAAEKAAADSASASSLDLADTLCPSRVCTTNDGNSWRYRDGLHITDNESRGLIPFFSDYLRRLPAGE